MHLCIRVMRFVDHSLGRHKARCVVLGALMMGQWWNKHPLNMGKYLGKYMESTRKRWENGEVLSFCRKKHGRLPRERMVVDDGGFLLIFAPRNLR